MEEYQEKTVAEFAAQFQISRDTINSAIRRNRLLCRRSGTIILIKSTDFERWYQSYQENIWRRQVSQQKKIHVKNP